MSKISSSSQLEEELQYLTGFGNEFATEALPGALPKRGNNPQRNNYNLITEQISGTAFTAPRAMNQRSWLYRKLPSTANIKEYALVVGDHFCSDENNFELNPNPLRWKPLANVAENIQSPTKNFVFGLETIAKGAAGNVSIHIYSFYHEMNQCSFLNSDGDFLIVPQSGNIRITSEMGLLDVNVGEICVVPRGIVFQVNQVGDRQTSKVAFGYVLELDGHFFLPELGPIGANGLANPRDFCYPIAWYDVNDGEQAVHTVYNKYGNKLFCRQSSYSPYNVVAWHGNYAPFKYDLSKFNVVNSVSFDHMDPSIFTVLTSPSYRSGISLADFVVFGPRWVCSEDTFRPPWYHRNCMSEFMGLINGQYDAKASGFLPGGASLHPIMTPHGPDSETFHRALREKTDKPSKLTNGIAFMFETKEVLLVNKKFIASCRRDDHYMECWSYIKERIE